MVRWIPTRSSEINDFKRMGSTMNTNVPPSNDHQDKTGSANAQPIKPPAGGEPVYGDGALPLCYLFAVQVVAAVSAALTAIGIAIYYLTPKACRVNWILYSA